MKRHPLKTLGVWFAAAATVLVIIFPVWWIVLSSITPKEQLFQTPIRYFPSHPTLENYKNLFANVDVPRLIWDTVVVTAFSVTFSLIVCLLAAYGFGHARSKGIKAAYALLIGSSFLPMISTILPMFELFSRLKLCDTYFVLILLYTNSFIPFTALILVSFMRQLPGSLEEAARVDGAGVMTVIFRILLPVMKPAVTTMAIINFILCINEFMTPLIFTTSKVSVLSVGITMIPRLNQYQVPWDSISALATIMLAPIVLFVCLFEKNILSGLMAGSVKQ